MFSTQIYDHPNSNSKMNLVERIKGNVLNNYNYNHKNSFKWANNLVYNTNVYSGIDRRSTFYTDPESAVADEVGDVETENLQEKLENAEKSLSLQVRKCENLISFFTNQIQTLTDELEYEKSWRTGHLTKIVKALMNFEVKLKNDQKLILNQLYAKDNEINKLASELVLWNERYGTSSNIKVSEVAQYCLACRKQYYRSEMANVGTQSRNSTKDDESSAPSIDYLSTSEDGSPSFFEARRNKRYISKRTSGTFKEYSRSQNMTVDMSKPNGNSNGNASEGDEKSKLSLDEATSDAKSDKIMEPFKSNSLGKSTQFESTEDWYASASDMDDSDSALSKPYGTNAVNPVLECVNQILLQQSFDGMMEANGNQPQEHSARDVHLRQKRVHFSTQNSMLQVPRDNEHNQLSLHREKDILKEQSFSYESIYSNEYEPIGSENVSSNHYVDMENKSSQEEIPPIVEKSKTPPALPPKPANLMKLRHVLGLRSDASLRVKENDVRQKPDTESEPDYCSISEVNDTVKSVQIVVDVHKSADSMSTSSSEDAHTEFTEESFADIPKLPNVQAIISPKKANSSTFIAQDNYITKSPAKQLPIHSRPPTLATDVQIKKPTPIKPVTPPKLTTTNDITAKPSIPPTMQPPVLPPPVANTIPISALANDNLPIQAEFDWYNLDAEYGKFGQLKDSVPKDGVLLELDAKHNSNNNNLGIEYNLDVEFNMENGVGSVHEEEDEELCNGKSMGPSGKSFQNFLDDTGLVTKPLPRKRKIYYTAPFV